MTCSSDKPTSMGSCNELVALPAQPLVNALGLHLRAAVALAECTEVYSADVWLVRGEERIDAKSPLVVVKAGLGPGESLGVEAIGPDAEAAVLAVLAFFETQELELRPVAALDVPDEAQTAEGLLRPADIVLGLRAATKEDAIRQAGDRLVKAGLVEPTYVEAMLEREAVSRTFLTQGLATPHGTPESWRYVRRTGFVICQFPNGVRFGQRENEIAWLVVAIAAKERGHLPLMIAIARSLGDPQKLAELGQTTDPAELAGAFATHLSSMPLTAF